MGTLELIVIGPAAREPLGCVGEVLAVPGRGLEGDRYFLKEGSFDRPPLATDGREVSLIEAESVEECNRRLGTSLTAADLRRNLVTRGVRLNDLQGKTFRVGGVRMHGVRLCHPCGGLVRRTGADVLAGLKGIGGLRAEVLDGGVLRVGDAVTPE